MSLRLLLLACVTLRISSAGAEPAPTAFEFDQYLIAPLRVHLLASEQEPVLCTTLTDADIERIIGKVNHVWLQAGLAFLVESIVSEEPELDESPLGPLPGEQAWLPRHIQAAHYRPDFFNVYYLKQLTVNGIYYPKAVFVKDTARLQRVEGGIDEPIPRVTSHELGHALKLPHRQDIYNLMASGTTGTTLNAAEIEIARASAVAIGRFRPPAEWLAEAAKLRSEGKESEATELERKLAALPMDSPPFSELRARLLAKPTATP